MKNKITHLALGFLISLSLAPMATATEDSAKKDAPAAEAKKADTMTQEQAINALVDGFQKAASGISAGDLVGKINSPQGDLATALKAITDAGYLLACYGDNDDVKACTKSDLVGKTPKTSDDKAVRGVVADKMKDAKDGRAFFTYVNAEKKDRVVVAFKAGDCLLTVGGSKK